jgi:dipeptidyl aminopeptidase/acylaminoacyl peptidase
MRQILFAALVCAAAMAPAAERRGFTANDLVMMDRVSDPQISPDGKRLAFDVRETAYSANKGVHSLWLIELERPGGPPRRLTAQGVNSTAPRWSIDGGTLFFLSTRSGESQVWRIDLSGGEAQQVTHLALDVNTFAVSPNGRQLMFSIDVFTGCDTLACSKKKLSERNPPKASGTLYDKLFVRHWDAWSDGRRSQLFIAGLDRQGAVSEEPRLLTKGIDGDVPSKPFGDDTEYCFSRDGKSVYFDVRIAGTREPWSTNFDIYEVPADGQRPPANLTANNPAWDGNPIVSADGAKLYYLSMKRPGFEADRFRIMERTLASGATREVAPDWDHSAGPLKISRDGRLLYTTADDNGEKPLFEVDVRSGRVRRLAGTGTVDGFDVVGPLLVFGVHTLKSPADLFRISAQSGEPVRLTALNAERLRDVTMGEYEFFEFKGARDETVQGYVVKPWNYTSGKKYPVAFLIHGGPQGAWLNDWHYRWNPQTYAGAGYAVVAINFHGSTGYGQAFTDSISGDWGGKPLEDLKRGYAAALAKYDWLDGSRACALGASYGGFMAYWIASQWREPWKCIVSHDGVFDNRMMGYSTEELWFSEWENKGTPFDNPESYERFNPANHVADWKVPMLVIHSANDFRVPLEQGLAAFTALQRRGIPSQFLTFPDENHWVQKPQDSVQWHETVLAWLRKWTGQ